jgi:hypothetical protein
VIATQYHDAFAVADLKGHENGDGLDGVIASIDVVAHEEVISVRRFSTDPIKNHLGRFRTVRMNLVKLCSPPLRRSIVPIR